MPVRGIRGATSVPVDTPAEVQAATQELLKEIFRANGIQSFDEIASAVFTTTADLTSSFPAEAARALGMNQVPLLCTCEIPVPNSMGRCLRILLHLNTDKAQSEIQSCVLEPQTSPAPETQTGSAR